MYKCHYRYVLLTCSLLMGCSNNGPKALQGHAEGSSLRHRIGRQHVLMRQPRVDAHLIGDSLDITDRNRLDAETRYRYETGQVLTVQQIIGMWQDGLSEEKIIHVINRTRSHYYLTPKQKQILKRYGVPRNIWRAIENVNKGDLEDSVPDSW